MGQVIAGRFELADHIASGGSGSIWAAWDRRREQWCAAKVLRHKDSGELLRFVREQGIQLDHRYLATPYGWAAEDEDVAISMPLVAGGTLDTALNDHGAFSSALAAQMLLQLLDALDHVHHAGWIHRDVKPANILLEPTGEGMPHLRLGDFGIAVREDDPRFTTIGWVNGTPGYLAPEAMDLAAPAPAQDLYAAGVVALRMLDPTLRGERGLEAAVLDPRRTLARIDGLDPRLAAVVAGLLDEDPGDRVAAAERAPRTLDVLAAPQTASGGYLTAAGEPFTVFRQVEVGEAARVADDATGDTNATGDGDAAGGAGTAPGPTAAPVPAPAAPAGAPVQEGGVAGSQQSTDSDRESPEPGTSWVPAPPVRTPRVGSPSTGPVAASVTAAGAERRNPSDGQQAQSERGAQPERDAQPGRDVQPEPPAQQPDRSGALGRSVAAALPWAMVLLGVVALVVAAVLLWPDGERAGADGDPAAGTGPSSPLVAATATSPATATSSATSSAPSSTAASSAPSAESSPAPGAPRTTPSGDSGTPVITSSVRSGDDCTALERGLVVTGADGQRLTCAERDGALTWEAGD